MLFVEDLGLERCGCVCTQVSGGKGVYQRTGASRDAGANGHAGPCAPRCLAGKVFIEDLDLKGGGAGVWRAGFYRGFGPPGVRVQAAMSCLLVAGLHPIRQTWIFYMFKSAGFS